MAQLKQAAVLGGSLERNGRRDGKIVFAVEMVPDDGPVQTALEIRCTRASCLVSPLTEIQSHNAYQFTEVIFFSVLSRVVGSGEHNLDY